MATPFKTIKGYMLEEVLGEGSFGQVYRGKHQDDGHEIAVKYLTKYQNNPDDLVVRKEIENLNKIPNYINLVNIIDHGEIDGEYWIFMELCDLGDLRNYFQNNKPDMAFKVFAMLEISKGVNYLHGNKIIHRDLKPANILLKSRSDHPLPAVKIADFGLSKCLDPGQSSLMHTDVGTKAFMAPEMFEKDARTGKPNYRTSVDIFALGLIFLTLLQSSGGKGEKMIPRAEDSVQSEGETIVGEAMFKRSNIQPEIKVAVSTDGDDEIVRKLKKLINQMTVIVHQRRPKADAVVKFIERLREIQEASAT